MPVPGLLLGPPACPGGRGDSEGGGQLCSALSDQQHGMQGLELSPHLNVMGEREPLPGEAAHPALPCLPPLSSSGQGRVNTSLPETEHRFLVAFYSLRN